MDVPRIIATQSAKDLIETLKQKNGELMFHLSGGCCDGSQPMCFPKGEFRTGSSDVCIGLVEDSCFYMARDQFEYLKHTQLVLDVTPGRGSSFSMEIPLGFRFFIRSRLFTDEEMGRLAPLSTD